MGNGFIAGWLIGALVNDGGVAAFCSLGDGDCQTAAASSSVSSPENPLPWPLQHAHSISLPSLSSLSQSLPFRSLKVPSFVPPLSFCIFRLILPPVILSSPILSSPHSFGPPPRRAALQHPSASLPTSCPLPTSSLTMESSCHWKIWRIFSHSSLAL